MKLKSVYSLLILVCSICMMLLTSCAQKSPIYQKHKTVFKIGDQPAWATRDWSDTRWERYLDYIPEGQVFWSRTRIDILQAPLDTLNLYGVRLEVYGEYEVFWDGILIGKNGNPGQEAELGPTGQLWTTFSIPAHLTNAGEHLMAIRSSLYHFPDHTAIQELKIDYHNNLWTDSLIETAYMHIFSGAFLIISFYFLFLFLSNKKEYPTLIFSVCCFLVFALVLTVFSKDYIPLHYSLHVIRLQVIRSFLLGISFLIPFYFSMQFPFPRRGLALMLYAGVVIGIFLINPHAINSTSVGMVLSMWFFSFGVVAYGTYKKIRGAQLVLATLILSMVIFLASGFVISLYSGLGLILLGMLYLLSLNIKAQRLAYENSLVQSTRLRLELLKKNIQPHFLMNTLTSLMDWVEEAPDKGVLFIEALAKEFDLFNQIEDQTLIPISQEIALCKTHLEIMAYRKEIDYIWEDQGIDPEQKVPPAIFHTLLENGITHNLPFQDKGIRFKLVYENDNDCKCYTFLTFATGVRRGTSTKEGTGLKYVKARLTESYQSNWDLISEPTADGWKNVIKIYS